MGSLSRILGFTVVCCVLSCAGYQAKQQEHKLQVPVLGSLVKQKGPLWSRQTQPIGRVQWGSPFMLTVQELPFNTHSYGQYTNYIKKAGKINSIKYEDSLPLKPKYLKLQLADKIALSELLNNDANTAIRSYLEKDPDYKMVTELSITFADAVLTKLLAAETVLLTQNELRTTELLLLNQEKEEIISLSEGQVFGYALSSFCWGEDRYHNKRIEALMSANERCPKGTEKKASKIQADKSYLKF